MKTIHVDGVAHDVGAPWAFRRYSRVLQYAEQYEVSLVDHHSRKTIYTSDGECLDVETYLSKKFGRLRTLRSLLSFKKRYGKYRALEAPLPNDEIDHTLYLPAADFFPNHRTDPAIHVLELCSAAFGFGFFEEIPALYIAKVMHFITDAVIRDAVCRQIGLSLFSYRHCIDGFQTLAEKMARRFDVRLNAEVTQVLCKQLAGKDRIVVRANQHCEEEFDRLVVAINPATLLDRMDMTSEESLLFNRIESYRYFSTLVKAENLPSHWFCCFEKSIDKEYIGHVVGMGDYPGAGGRYCLVQYASPQMSKEQMLDIAASDIEALGGRITEVISQNEWSHLPHVKTGALLDAYGPRFRNLQGSRGVYYVGGPLRVETMEDSANFAESVVNDHFV